MNDLQIFNNPEFGEVRAVELDGEPWFVGKDVATALGYSNPRDALARHVDEEDKNTVAFHDGTSGNPNQTIINESGVYSLIFSSKLPDAKKFKRWVTAEVLPSIRKTGAYLTPQAKKEMEDLVLSFLSDFDARLSALEGGAAAPQSPAGLLTAPEAPDCSPGPAARKRWMRTVSEKLNDLSVKFAFMPHNEILHRLYVMLEQQTGVSLDENRLQVMEEYGLPECSVLTGIFYNSDLREAIQRNIRSHALLVKRFCIHKAPRPEGPHDLRRRIRATEERVDVQSVVAMQPLDPVDVVVQRDAFPPSYYTFKKRVPHSHRRRQILWEILGGERERVKDSVIAKERKPQFQAIQ